mmetsp:Transcript_54461/g.151757  ORF Transcript_54461/g.151757 Transcript_54461/m.151757 type:complete len:280 (+) Transcript_54461:378-1217(+)
MLCQRCAHLREDVPVGVVDVLDLRLRRRHQLRDHLVHASVQARAAASIGRHHHSTARQVLQLRGHLLVERQLDPQRHVPGQRVLERLRRGLRRRLAAPLLGVFFLAGGLRRRWSRWGHWSRLGEASCLLGKRQSWRRRRRGRTARAKRDELRVVFSEALHGFRVADCDRRCQGELCGTFARLPPTSKTESPLPFVGALCDAVAIVCDGRLLHSPANLGELVPICVVREHDLRRNVANEILEHMVAGAEDRIALVVGERGSFGWISALGDTRLLYKDDPL